MRRKRPEKRSQRPQTRLDWFRRFRDDPQDVGVGIPTGQTGGSCRAGEESTCGLFASVQDVWSPNGPQQQAPSTPPAPLVLAVGLVAVLESMIAKTIARDAQRQLFRDFACTVLP
jgi:hypothetical protein